MSVGGKIVVFDHAVQARQYVPLLGGGRVTRWQDADTAYWLPLELNGVNRVCIVTDYDPYSLPPGLPVASETHGREWRGHVHAALCVPRLRTDAAQADGSWHNLALEHNEMRIAANNANEREYK